MVVGERGEHTVLKIKFEKFRFWFALFTTAVMVALLMSIDSTKISFGFKAFIFLMFMLKVFLLLDAHKTMVTHELINNLLVDGHIFVSKDEIKKEE